MRRFLLSATLVLLLSPAITRADSIAITGEAVVREMNLARQNPAQYAAYIAEMRSQFSGNIYVGNGRIRLRTKEGVRALDEAITFLQRATPQGALAVSEGLCHAAADHVAEQADGSIGHRGRGWSNPGDRISRYGGWGGTWGENISYGQHSARDIVLALIIDDGVRGRGHRKNIFNARYNVAGAAYGPHARYGSVCSIEFAGSYNDRGGELRAQSFTSL